MRDWGRAMSSLMVSLIRYVTAQGHTGVMFLCEAALGTQRFITRDGEVGHRYHRL